MCSGSIQHRCEQQTNTWQKIRPACVRSAHALIVDQACCTVASLCRPYAALAEELLKQKTSTIGAHATQVDFLHLPIEDFSVAPDDELSELADRCCELTRSGTKMYIHCQGGHGRTGTLAAILLGRLYSLPAAEALRLCQQYHDTRADSGGAHSPETSQQRAQVCPDVCVHCYTQQPVVLAWHQPAA